MTCYLPPEAPTPGEFIQSSATTPEPNIISARRERDGGWLVIVTTKDGVINKLRLPPSQDGSKEAS